MRLLVTGGAGFIGSAFVRRRLESGSDEVVVLDKLTYAGSRERLAELEATGSVASRYRFVIGDIADESVVRDLVSDVDVVVNFAAESHVDRSILDAEAFLRTGVLGVHVLLEAARAASRPVRFIQVSTDEVYGSIEDGQCSEDHPMGPRSPYAAAKAAGELLVASYGTTYGLDTIVTRGANTYGPFQHPEKLIPLFVTNAIDDQPLPLYGDGLQRRDWLYVDDHADAVGFLIDHGESGAVYNVPGDQERTNRAVTEAIVQRLGKDWSLVRRVEDRPGHDRRYAMTGARLAALGWRPKVRFEDGIATTTDWFLARQDWWRPLRSAAWRDYYERQYGRRLERSSPA